MKKTPILLLAAIALLGAMECPGQSIFWSGKGDAASWSDPQNWAGQQVPGPADTVIITNGPGTNVILSSGVSVASILCSKAFTIFNGSLAVTAGASSLGGAFAMIGDTTLSVSGSGTILTSAASVAADGANFSVSGGAMLSLPELADYQAGCTNVLWQASGMGSVLEFRGAGGIGGITGLISLQGASCGGALKIQALSGAEVRLLNLEVIANGNVAFLSDGAGSLITLSNLSAFVLESGQGSLAAQNGGTMLFNSRGLLLANVAINIPPGNPVLPATVIASQTFTLYGRPWQSYFVQERSTQSPNVPWVFLARVPLTNSFQPFAVVPPPNRAYLLTEFVADPPILDVAGMPGQGQLVLFGRPDKTYQIQTTANLNGAVAWKPGTIAAMTNSFRILPLAVDAAPMVFFRAQQQ